ncbi:tyrosine decarboxylase-like isoform X1 [Ctenocephalides felis]|uniref:tyrosine decarboxylase-like isoform X1 n=1 Tax=Ctenocephalides felis TaxID=7515 RepID=UPI000E6E3698|nr:tyrosine decarboxylase-like isoform X1 [Ctenocephalides felis]
MDAEDFRHHGKEMVDYICSYLENIEKYRVIPDVEPGYLKTLLPSEAPETGEEWTKIMEDVEDKIMPGVTHWQHPRFHAYFPSGNSYPSILGDMLSDAIGCIGFSWVASPACTELETIVLDWLAKATGLPESFLSSSPAGGGVIQGSASECILTCMIAARAHTIERLKEQICCNGDEGAHDSVHLPRLVAYCSQESHSCVEKAAKIALVKLRILEVEEDGSLSAETLKKAMQDDVSNNLVPFFVSVTLGSTACTSFDDLSTIGPVCKSFPGVWLHVDAAYAGSAFICPELRYLQKGIEYADSYNTNTNKWLLVNFDCSCLWVRDRWKLTKGLVVDPLYLQHANDDETIDYRHWGVPLSRRFRSLKLWFVLRKYGIEGLRGYIRNHIDLAKIFEAHIVKDLKFELMNNVRLGLVCFRLAGSDKMNQQLLDHVHNSGQLFMVPAKVRGKFSIRFCVVSEHATARDIEIAWETINAAAYEVLKTGTPKTPEPTIANRPPHLRPFGRQLSRQFSFTRSVSREVYKREHSKSSLHDGATPILVPEDEENCGLDDCDYYGNDSSCADTPRTPDFEQEFQDFDSVRS